MWQDSGPYGASMAQNSPYGYGQPPPMQGAQPGLQFYSPGPADSTGFYSGRSSLEGHVGAQGSINAQGGPGTGFGGNIQPAGGWWTAFGTGGFEGEPPLLEGMYYQLGINFDHVWAKSLTVLNPLRRVDAHIMDDADLAGPLLFFLCFGMFLLFSGKPQFGYIYGVGLMGSMSIYLLLNLMSEPGIDAYRVASVLGYCLLPMVGVGALSVMVTLDGSIGYMLSMASVIWCTYAASGIFVAVLRMSDQRLLVAYPIGLLYGCFALLSVFTVGRSNSG
ncbi:Yip1-domain-containing protein [Heliocybe sulcata]|uniref:Protein YIP n=1 Tax=Heliocybe sulcata TaxID=5364 RepID=A0A5C3NAW9_9AGAM|nr:Yip1-domain-containing protein [Heliocybe sulcata]